MGSGLFSPGSQEETQTTQIDPRMAGSADILRKMTEQMASLDPRNQVYMGPTVAASNDAMRGVMDSTASASNAFGIPAVSAAAGLPQAFDFGNGLTGYSGGQLALEGLSPQMNAFLSSIYGENSPFVNRGAPSAPAAPRAPSSNAMSNWNRETARDAVDGGNRSAGYRNRIGG